MNRQNSADTTANRKRPRKKRWGCLRVLGVFAGLFALLIVYVIIAVRYDCVAMPNGLLIGRTTFFSSLVGWDPDISIRYPDGRLLRRGDGRIGFYDDESVGGDYPGSICTDGCRGSRNNRFVYVNGVGLILESQNPRLFHDYWERKIREHDRKQKTKTLHPEWTARERFFHGDVTSGNLYLVMMTLTEDPKNLRNWCPIPLFAPSSHKPAPTEPACSSVCR